MAGRPRGPFCNHCPPPRQPARAATQELALLISRMQANADQVERDILETQKKLQQVRTLSGWEGWGMETQSQCQRVPRGSPVKRERQPGSSIVHSPPQPKGGLSVLTLLPALGVK